MDKSSSYEIVLIKFRTAEENENEPDVFYETLKSNNFSTTVVNPLLIKYKNFEYLFDKLQHPELFAGLVFISPRGVNGVYECLRSFNAPLHPEWSDLPVYVFNGNTNKMVESKLKLLSKGQATGNREKMADLIVKDENLSKPFLLVHGSLNVSIGTFERKKIPYVSVNVYSRELHPDLEAQLEELKSATRNNKLIITFFSPYGMQLAEPFLPRDSNISFIAVGRMTQRMAEDLKIPLDRMCEKPCANQLLSSVREIISRDAFASWCQNLSILDSKEHQQHGEIECSNSVYAF